MPYGTTPGELSNEHDEITLLLRLLLLLPEGVGGHGHGGKLAVVVEDAHVVAHARGAEGDEQRQVVLARGDGALPAVDVLVGDGDVEAALGDGVLDGGVEGVHGDCRVDYLCRHIASMGVAVDDGVGLLGYTPWGCIDLTSASTGEFKKRYGFVYVDSDDFGEGTFKRYRKDSFAWYQKAIASNGEDMG